MVAMSTALEVLYPLANPLTDFRVTDNGGVVSITYWNPALGTQPTQAQLDAVTQAQVDAAVIAKLRAAAKQYHVATQAENRALRATMKLLIDESNALREWMAAMKAATAASTTLANLKTGIASLPVTPQRTYVQARNAIEALIDND